MKRIPLEHTQVGNLFVVALLPEKQNRQRVYLCHCICGNDKKIQANHLREGQKSCGCLQNKGTHRHTINGNHSKTYNSWVAMLQRCEYPAAQNYSSYGGRGITVCEHWHKFENFLADMGERPEGHTLHRKDNDKGYDKENCEWQTVAFQNSHKRDDVGF